MSLVQRFKKPYPKDTLDWHTKVDQVFGGGSRGLTDEAWDVLKPVLSIDRMGAAEYEWGALPEALKRLTASSLVFHEMTIPGASIQPNSQWASNAQTARWKVLDEAKAAGVKPPRAKKFVRVTPDATVWIVCATELLTEAQAFILELASDKVDVKCGAEFTFALDPVNASDQRVCGWLELSRSIFFTIDETMANAFWSIFKTESV